MERRSFVSGGGAFFPLCGSFLRKFRGKGKKCLRWEKETILGKSNGKEAEKDEEDLGSWGWGTG